MHKRHDGGETMTVRNFLHIADSKATASESKLSILCDQIVDSLVVGGIAGFSAYIASGVDATSKVFGLAFGLTFLIKLKEYRKIR